MTPQASCPERWISTKARITRPPRAGAGRVIVTQMGNELFRALSHPIRRGIVERLGAGPATVGEASKGFGVSKPVISKHVRVLEESGVVVRTIEGRTHRLALDLDSLGEAIEWVDRQRAIWNRMIDAVDESVAQGRHE